MKFFGWLFALGLVFCCAQAFAEVLNFSVANDTAVTRAQWPITGGLALIRGAAKDLANVQLVRADGQPVEFESKVMAKWELAVLVKYA